jgi:hypothetical protein
VHATGHGERRPLSATFLRFFMTKQDATHLTCNPQVFYLRFASIMAASFCMTTTINGPIPKLDPPGAGLPFPESLIARTLFHWAAWRGTREQFTALFKQERDTIAELVDSLDDRQLSQPVLIDRLRGLEDSSRNWSVLMTLDHLRIVNRNMTDTVLTLSKDLAPNRKVSTAGVKPSPDVTKVVIYEYALGCESFLNSVAAIPNLKTRARLVHPWFGALDASGWHTLIARHMSIHRRQIQSIIAAL